MLKHKNETSYLQDNSNNQPKSRHSAIELQHVHVCIQLISDVYTIDNIDKLFFQTQL